MRVQNWDDYRFVAVLARTGSLSDTSVQLGVDRSTVQRRIRGLESKLGYKLFVRAGNSYRALPEADPILKAARTLEAVMNGDGTLQDDESPSLSGSLSVTTTDSTYMAGVAEMIDSFQRQHPAMTIHLTVTNRKLLLDRLEADVAIRPSDSPPEHFVGRRVCDLAFGVYASRAYVEKNTGLQRDEHDWLAVADSMLASAPGRWMEAFVPPERRVLRADSFIAIAEACRLGRGAAMLPKAYATRLPDLLPLDHLMEDRLATGLWLLTHADIKSNPRVRSFVDHMWKRLSKAKKRFAGEK